MDAKKIILKETGFKSINDLKAHLKSIAEFQYGCYYSEIKKPTFRVMYTSNKNCFASYIVSMNGTGMQIEKALDASSITAAGKARGCSNYYLK